MKRDEELNRLIATFPIQAKAFITKLRQNERRCSGVAERMPICRLRNFDAGFTSTSRVVNPTHYAPAPFCAETTYNKSYGNRNGIFGRVQRALRFGETPVFTDSILYPTQHRRLQSTTHETFAAKPFTPAKPIKPAPTNLRCEGAHEFSTTHRSAYVWNPMHQRIAMHNKEARISQPVSEKLECYRKPFMGETQFQADYPPRPAWSSVCPSTARAPRHITPTPSEVPLSENDERHLSTEHRDQFSILDLSKNPVPKSYRKEVPPYCPPTVRFTSTTVTRSDFPPYPLSVIQAANKPAIWMATARDALDMDESALTTEEANLLKEYLQKLEDA